MKKRPFYHFLANRITHVTGHDAETLNTALNEFTAHSDIVDLVLDQGSHGYVPSLICKPRSRRAYDKKQASALTMVADAYDNLAEYLSKNSIVNENGDSWQDNGLLQKAYRV